MIRFRPYQLPIFLDRTTGILLLHWSRQIGKSFTLAAWAVDRLLTRPGRLVTVLSNSKDNGIEFITKAAEICRMMGVLFEQDDTSPDITYENMRMEIRITVGGKLGRIKVLAANARTARGFSGDLILDEFAFHEKSGEIWDAAEPILSSNPDYLCRIASTGNGKYNLFYRMVSNASAHSSESLSSLKSFSSFALSRVTRTQAYEQGVTIYDPNTRQPITPDQARAKALDKASYGQNYDCLFNDENMSLLTHELISAAERSPIAIDSQSWSDATLSRLAQSRGFFLGNDIGRHRDLSVVTALERDGATLRVLGMLRMSGLRGPDQLAQLNRACQLPTFRSYQGDMTGLGTFFIEFLQEAQGQWRIHGVNFASTEPTTDLIRLEGRKQETARVTEIMAVDLLAAFEDRSLEIPADPELRDDLRKPEKITSPGGRVSIAAVRDEAGHADHFWSLALAVRAAHTFTGAIETTAGIHHGATSARPRFQPRRLVHA